MNANTTKSEAPKCDTDMWIAICMGVAAFLLVCWYDMRLGMAFALWRLSADEFDFRRRKRGDSAVDIN